MTRNSLSIVLLWALLLTAPAAAEQPERLLRVTSQGYSRFEIDGRDIVGHYGEGVEFTYMGYTMRADELWFNQNTQQARAEGNVTLAGEGLTIYTAKLEVDGLAGVLSIDSPISGFAPDAGLDFQAGYCTLTFTPEGLSSRLEDVTLELGGGIEVTGDTLRKLSCRGLSFNGSTRRFTTDGQFVLAAHFATAAERSEQPEQSGILPFQLQDAVIRGEQLSGMVTENGQIQVVEIRAPELISQEVSLKGDQLMLTDTTVGPQKAFTNWEAELNGTPVYGSAELTQGAAEFEAEQLQLSGDSDGVSELAFTDTVKLIIDGSQIVAEMVVLKKEASGYWLSLPIGAAVNFDLATLANIEPFEVPAEILEAESGR